jgi:hypothetical protein
MNYIKKILFSAALLLFLATSNCFARSFDGEEVVSFARFINDLANTSQTSRRGVLCVLGNDEIGKILFELDKSIIDLDKIKKYELCKAIYVAQSKEKNVREELIKFNKSKILTIAVFDNFTEIGGVVRVDIGRRNFELTVNSNDMREFGIKFNSLAMSLIIN